MLLSQYQAITQSLIQTPASPNPLISTTLLNLYINLARGQVAGQSECIPTIITFNVTAGQTAYPFSSLVAALTPADQAIIAGIINIRMINMVTGTGNTPTGQQRVTSREWPWFNNYIIAKPVETTGPPKTWSQYRQGSTGIFFLNIPDQTYSLAIDAVCYPADLTGAAGEVDAIPFLWDAAVPFYAAYYAYMAFQRQADADHMFQRFNEMMGRARTAVTPGVLPTIYPQGPDPMLPNRLGVHPAQQRGAATAQGA